MTRRTLARSGIGLAPLVLAALLGGGLLAVELDRQMQARFRERLFDLPAQVYARPLELFPGARPGRETLLDHLRRTGYREASSERLVPGEFRVESDGLTLARRGFHGPDGWFEPAEVRVRVDRARVRQLRGPDGRHLARVTLEPEPIGAFRGDRWVDRRPLPLDAYPKLLVQAVIAVEDRRFRKHWGIDLRRAAAAALANLRAGRVEEGGSTLTQQLVKNLYLTPERSWARKLREAPMALLLDRRLSKDEILEAYLNEIYLGQRGPVAIHGMGAAARHYFGVDAADLDAGQAALLAGMIRSPGLYSPVQQPEAARERRDAVLALLRERGALDEETAARALAEPLAARPAEPDEALAPYFLAQLRAELAERHSTGALETAGYAVHTPLDARLQRLAERAVARGLADLETRVPRLADPEAPLQAALVAIQPGTGAILALVGGRDFAASQFNRAVQARRQPGSAFKPVVALAGLARGRQGLPAMTLATRLDDEPLSVELSDGEWAPGNHTGEYRGWVTLRQALEDSLNVPMARAGLELGPRRIVETARRLGIESRLSAVPSLALGTSEVTLLELTGAYAVLAAGGLRADPYGLGALLDAEGRVLERVEPEPRRAFAREEAYLLTSALEGVVDRGTGAGLRAMGYRGAVAGKTGTTNDYRDAWFLGYTPDLAVGVWVGFDDNRTVRTTGGVAALPIFARFLIDAVGPAGGPAFEPPPGLERVRVNPELQLRAEWGCAGEREIFLAGTAPLGSCGGRGPLDWLLPRRWSRGRTHEAPDA